MATVELQVQPWQERGIQVMVLLSFMLQLVLLILAEFRRRMDSGVLRAVIWSAYILADSTAIYILGHLSVTSRSEYHEMMAFWAPFLLLHLGGQDNITAYAIEDNRLWLRHLHTLVVQVAAAAHILYESTVVGNQVLLRNAAFLMFVVGILKYGERVWALKRANTSASGTKYQMFRGLSDFSSRPPPHRRDTEGLLRIAHLMLDVPKDVMQGALPNVVIQLSHTDAVIPAHEIYRVVEMQLSLMHDLVYSKAEVIHTWYGLCVRIISPVFTTIAFVLFHRSDLWATDNHYSRADVVITYVLLGGAVTLEMVSVVRAMFSRWSSLVLWKLAYNQFGRERYIWSLLARAIVSLRRFVLPKRNGSKWWWSGCMGQQNLIDLCVGSKASRRSSIARWMGVENWWNTLAYSSSIPVSATIKDLVVKQARRSGKDEDNGRYYHTRTKSTSEEPDHIINSRGRWALEKWGLYRKLGKFVDSVELDESIIMWHLATDIFIRWSKDQGKAAADDAHLHRLAAATEAMSNYMLYLLAARPYMLPGSVSRSMYIEVCYCLTGHRYTTAQDVVSLLTPSAHLSGNIMENPTLYEAHKLACELVRPESGQPVRLEMLAELWTDIMCYAGYGCSGYSHLKQLSNGGELLTIAALVVDYTIRKFLKPWSSAEKEEEAEERRTATLGAAGNMTAVTDIVLQPTRTPLDEPRSPSSRSSDEITDVPALLWLDEPRSTYS